MIENTINRLNKKGTVLEVVRSIKALKAENKKELFAAFDANETERMSDVLLVSLSRIKSPLRYIEEDLK
jgi:hypothetical protein